MVITAFQVLKSQNTTIGSFVTRLDGFHTIISFLGCIRHIMAGLCEHLCCRYQWQHTDNYSHKSPSADWSCSVHAAFTRPSYRCYFRTAKAIQKSLKKKVKLLNNIHLRQVLIWHCWMIGWRSKGGGTWKAKHPLFGVYTLTRLPY